MNHIVKTYLRYADIKFTSIYLNKLIDSVPLSDSYIGIKKILSRYLIDSKGLLIDSEILVQLEGEFICVYKEELVFVANINKNQVAYYDKNNNKFTVSFSDFINSWNKTVLIVEHTEGSGEPSYNKNYIEHIFSLFKIPFIVLLFLIPIYYNINISNYNSHDYMLLALYFIGVMLSFTINKQSIKKTSIARKVCEINEKTSCNSVLSSEGASLWGIISWSEIGLVYFISCFTSILFVKNSEFLLFILNVCSLPYTIWSIWYQWKKIEKWCPLCLFIMLLFWIIFIVYLFNIDKISSIYTRDIILDTIYIFTVCLIVIKYANLLWKRAIKSDQIKMQYLKLKFNDEVFFNLLKKGEELNIDNLARSLKFGNSEAKNIVTIVIHPYCKHCADLYNDVLDLINVSKDNICLEIIFIGEDSLKNINKYLIGIYLKCKQSRTLEIYLKWFELKSNFKDVYDINIENNETILIYNAQRLWGDKATHIKVPCVFYNNKKLPSDYKLSDLEYFI